MNLTKTCSKCGTSKPLDEFHNDKSRKDGKNLYCKECIRDINKKYNRDHKEEVAIHNKKYNREHKDEIRQKGGHLPMHENKSCALYLGIVVAKRLCRHLFKDVEVMPNNNTGYNIICNKGKKIDVKSACITFSGKYPRWLFRINKNTTADFFILIAFDNRIDLNPLHMWMIPVNEVNHLLRTSIFLSTIHKWDKWKQDINNAQLCCTEIKAEQRGK